MRYRRSARTGLADWRLTTWHGFRAKFLCSKSKGRRPRAKKLEFWYKAFQCPFYDFD
jgi:hypothetical protein